MGKLFEGNKKYGFSYGKYEKQKLNYFNKSESPELNLI
jgi:hypothetical protein